MSSKGVLGLIAILVVIIGTACLFQLEEGQGALISHLGELKKNKENQVVTYKPGLHVKVPLVENVIKIDVRLQTTDISGLNILTNEQKSVIVDYFAKWQVNDLALFYTRASGQLSRASSLLEAQVNAALRAEIGKRSIKEVVFADRIQIMDTLNAKANETAKKLGLDVIDVRIKTIDLPDDVNNSVFDRMRAEREKEARKFRSEGRAIAEGTRAAADKDATVIEAKANNQANQIRATGDAEAASIYANAYNKDPEFYAFYRSLHAYDNTFSGQDSILLLSPESQFFEYFNKAK